MDNANRQTGRTTRMLEEAKERVLAGHRVTIVAANHREQVRLSRLLRHEMGIPPSSWNLIRVVAAPHHTFLAQVFTGVLAEDLFFDHFTCEIQIDQHRAAIREHERSIDFFEKKARS